jgi:hypothetical protein
MKVVVLLSFSFASPLWDKGQEPHLDPRVDTAGREPSRPISGRAAMPASLAAA